MSLIFSTSRRVELAVLAALAVIYYAVPWPATGPVAVWLGAPLTFLFLVAPAGIAVARMLRLEPRDGLEAAGVRLILGLFVALLGCFLWALWEAPLDAFRYGFPIFAIVLFVAVPHRDDSRPPLDRNRVSRGERRTMWALGAFIVLVAAIVWIAGPNTHYTADTIDHAAYVNEIERTQDPFPHTAFYKDAGADGADLRKSLLHSFFGVLKRHLGIDALALFAFLSAAQLIILCLAIYTATLWMFSNRWVALVSVLLFAIAYDGGVGSKITRVMFYPNRFGIAPLMLFAASAMTALRRPSRQTLALCAIFGFTAAAVHVQYIVFTALVAFIVIVWKTCSPCSKWSDHLKHSFAAAMAAGLAILPYALYRLVTSYQTNDLHEQVQGALFVGGGLFVADPMRVWDSLGWMGLAALIAIVPLWRHRREVPGIGFGIASMLTVLLIVVNPLVLPVVFEFLTYLVFRIGRVAPYYMIAALLITSAFGVPALSRATHRLWWRVATVLAMVAAILGAGRVVNNRHVLFASSAAEKRVSHERWTNFLIDVTDGIPEESVIASDPITSYYTSAFTPYYVLCTLDQHAPPNDSRADERMAAARDILSPYTSPAEKARIMDANGVTHVLVNEDLPRGLVLKYWTLDPDVAATARRLFADLPGAFEPVAQKGRLTLFRRTDKMPRLDHANVPVVRTAPADARAIGKKSGEATLVAARLDAVTARPRDDVDIDLYWSRDTKARPGNYVVALRFDYAGLELPMGGKPFPKIARKFKEQIEGIHYRFRTDHILQSGFYGPDRWENGDIVHDPVTVRIPRGLAPGTYSVQARLIAIAATPNTDLRSYFFDDDMYSGVEIGRIEIGK